MCGIVGWLSFRPGGSDVRADALARAVLTLHHRGPDRQRLALWRPEDGLTEVAAAEASALAGDRFQVGLGHSRLSIIDLSTQSDQPMVSADGRYVLVFNGEIYDYVELRAQLEAQGVAFRTRSDTEVLLQALIHWGGDALPRLNGMWAFAFFDTKERSLLAARDRFGKKPLFVHRDAEGLVLGSEYKSLFAILGESRRRLEPAFVDHFVAENRWLVSGRASAYAGVETVPPGSLLRVDLESGRVESRVVEDAGTLVTRLEQPPGPGWEEALGEELRSAVRLRLRSDVPVGILLSGGVDSTLVAGLAARLGEGGDISWYAGDTRKGNDLGFARQVAESLDVPLQVVDVRADEQTLDLVARMTAQYELPVWLLGNSIAMFRMYEAMHAEGIRVVLDGTGGDEIFGGYFRFYARNAVSDQFGRRAWGELASFLYHCWLHGQYPLPRLLRHLGRLVSGRSGPGGAFQSLEAAQLEDIRVGNLPSWIFMNDQNSMAHSVESRSPLLDYRLAKYLKLPAAEKFGKGFNKLALRRALPPDVSDAVRWRRDKQGFSWNADEMVSLHRSRMLQRVHDSAYLKDHYPAELVEPQQIGAKRLLSLHAVALLDELNASRRRNEALAGP